MNPETIAAIFGGGALGMIVQSTYKYLTNKRTMTLSNEEILRKELQDQIDEMKAQIAELKKEVDVWRDKYFDIYEEHIQLKVGLNTKNPT
jgi:molybdopterin converting factor small subunit